MGTWAKARGHRVSCTITPCPGLEAGSHAEPGTRLRASMSPETLVSTQYTQPHLAFYISIDMNSGPQVCTANALIH